LKEIPFKPKSESQHRNAAAISLTTGDWWNS